MAEWLKAHAWKACKRATASGVRIPLSPFDKLTASRRELVERSPEPVEGLSAMNQRFALQITVHGERAVTALAVNTKA